ncbi:WAT1-related protein At5g40240-like [Coffea arabica]|uniref:WAT1-related protein n=1 Tax=Coffea arabica TaxID=13443 RepID=A0ABM4V9E4_COFAR
MVSRGERCCHGEVFPFTAMVTVECIDVGLSAIFKAATLKGLNHHIFMLYSSGISALLLLPLCFFFHRKSQLPPLTFGLLARFFFLGIVGFLAQYLGYKGIGFSTPTLASAMTNLTPATTFVLAVLLRMEKLKIKSFSSQAKIMGSVVTIAGALLVVLYKGPMLIKSPASPSLGFAFAQQPAVGTIITGTQQSDWVKGGALLAAKYVLGSLWYIYQWVGLAVELAMRDELLNSIDGGLGDLEVVGVGGVDERTQNELGIGQREV